MTDRDTRRTLLLLSGGVDSSALAFKLRPTNTLFIDYGQRSAEAEGRAAQAVARGLLIDHAAIRIDHSATAGGLLSGQDIPQHWPSPEWWPFRNQMLVTSAAAWAVVHANSESRDANVDILTGSVLGDGDRHKDGGAPFYQALNILLHAQEGNLSVAAPAINMSTVDLVKWSGIPDSLLAWTHSCHTSNLPCGECPGCYKRDQVLSELSRLR
ncbi:MAG: 7-cyano-7-deazaguanine synthase [Leifsonia sp.]|nr:7-cyano-7-deazaguanine synthase [Leifsonia sp.]